MYNTQNPFYWLSVFLLLSSALATIQAQNTTSLRRITTIAGGGVCDGGLAIKASLANPASSALSPDGSLFIADSNNHRIRQVFPNGTITTIAGTGFSGYNGDGIEAIRAQLKNPVSVVVNSMGEVLFSDNGNNRIRKILTNGTIITIVGTGVNSFSGDNGLARNAAINYPYGLTLNSKEELLFTDVNNNRIRQVFNNGTIITVAGSNSQGYNGDNMKATSATLFLSFGVAVDTKDNIYIADTNNNRIRKVLLNGTIVTIAGTGTGDYYGDGGLATLAKINSPYGVAVSSLGEVYFSDSNRIRKVSTNGTITTFAGTSLYGFTDNTTVNLATLASPELINFAKNTSDLYIADKGNHRIRKISNGFITTIAGQGSPSYCGENVDSRLSALSKPKGAALDSLGNIYVADTSNHRVRKISYLDGTITTIAGTGSFGYNGDGILATSAQVNKPTGIAFDSIGNIYIADSGNNRIRKILTNGTILTIAGVGLGGYNGDGIPATNAKLNSPVSVTVDSNDLVYITDTYNHRIRLILPSGNISTVIGGSVGFNGDYLLPNNTKLNYPQSIAFDSSNNMYIADTYNNRIRKMFTNGTIITVAGTGTLGYNGDGIEATNAQLKYPQGIAIDGDELLIADSYNNRIRRVLSNGNITTITGTGDLGYSEDGTTASASKINNPSGVILRRNGEIIVIDSDNSRLRVISTLRTCNGTFANNPNVCNGLGVCFAPDVCDCGDLYGGQFCEFSKCFGIISNSSKVCSSRGVCNSPNTCICNPGFYGNNCELSTCFGIVSNESSVCSGNGNCTATDSCQCFNGWFGFDCSIPSCFNIFANDSSVCSGNGNCSTVNKCDCQFGWTGLDCSIIVNTTTLEMNNSNTNNSIPNNNGTLSNDAISNSTLNSNSTVTNNTITNNTTVNNSNNTTMNTNETVSLNNNSTVNNITNNNITNTNSSNNTIVNNNTLIGNNVNTTTTSNNNTLVNNTTQSTTQNSTKTPGNSDSWTCFEIPKTNSAVCGGHGLCISQNICQCKANSADGYWTGSNCDQCQANYCGDGCKSNICSQSNDNSMYALFALISIPIVGGMGLVACIAFGLRLWFLTHRKKVTVSSV